MSSDAYVSVPNVILGIRTHHPREMPFGELNELYTHIFTSVTVKDREKVLLILGLHLLVGSAGIYSLMDIRDLEHFFLLNRGDIQMLFGDLISLVVISEVKPHIHLLHASLGDFLLDQAWSKEFYIDLSNIHTRCMHLCFHHIKQCTVCCHIFLQRKLLHTHI